MGPGFSVCLFELQKIQPKESPFGQQRALFVGFDHMREPQDVRSLDVCMRIPNSKHTWASVCCSRVCIHVGLRDHFGFGLSSFKATPVQLLCVAKLATWLAPPHVCLLACSWPLPARRCFASWAPLQVLLQEALR